MIYLDNAATSFPKPDCVHQEMDRFLREDAANPGRAGHKMAVAAERMLDATRHAITQLIGGTDPDRLIFTLNCTDALNMAIKGIVRDGDHVITTHLEHNSVSRPLQALADAKTIELTRIEPDGNGFVEPDDFRKAIRPRTKLIVMTHASNALGTIQPVAEVGAIVRQAERLFLVDAAQTIGALPIQVEQMQIDLLAWPGHKSLLGPTGTGGLYVGERVADIGAWREGGTGGDSSSPTQPRLYPYFLEGGTPNTVGVAGLGAGVKFVRDQGLETTLQHEQALVGRIIEALGDEKRIKIIGSRDPASHVGAVSLTLEGMASQDAGAILDESFDIATRPGLHCAPYTHKMTHTFPDGTLRVSPGYANTPQEVDALLDALRQMVD